MKENTKLITVLNQILIDEINSIDQNIFHPKVIENLNNEMLFEEIEKETLGEIKQAEWLVKRIMFLEVLRTRQHSINFSQHNSHKNYEQKSNMG